MAVTFNHIQEALGRIKPYVIKTQVVSNAAINKIIEGELFFKCENLQKIGAFKARGAVNAVLQLSEAEKEKGVATHSSGNHAQALAYAAKTFGCKAYIVMPSTSSKVKIEGVKKLGAEIFFCEPTQHARETTLQQIVEKTGAYFIPPYNHKWIMAGQGTAALELLEEKNDIQNIIVPVGGGGFLSGTCIAAHGFNNEINVYAGEPALANDAFMAVQTGNVVANPNAAQTIADGLRTALGDLTYPVIQQHVKEIITVEENEIIAAMKLIWENLQMIIEPSSAVPVAAVLKRKELFRGKKTGLIFSGGNVDVTAFPFFPRH